MHKDKVLCTFSFNHNDPVFWEYDPKLITYAPFFLKKLHFLYKDNQRKFYSEFANGLRAFMCDRTVGLSRCNENKILRYLNLKNAGDFEAILQKIFYVSLNDNLWIKKSDDNISYKSINPYFSAFDDNIIYLTLTAELHDEHQYSSFNCALDVATGGSQNKAWCKDKSQISLLKTDDTDVNDRSGFFINQIYAEFFACQVAKFLDFDAVNYDITLLKNHKACCPATACPLINDYEYSLVSISECLQDLEFKNPNLADDLNEVVHSSYKVNTTALEFLGKEKFTDMACLDCLIYNRDRHHHNYAMMKNNHTLKYKGLSKLYDHGQSLFALIKNNDLDFEYQKVMHGGAVTGNIISLDRRFLSLADDSYIDKLDFFSKNFSLQNSDVMPFDEEKLDFSTVFCVLMH